MKVSAVIPSYQAADALKRCLDSLAGQRLGEDDTLEVVVVDDGSADDTEEVAGAFGDRLDLRYVFKPRTRASGRSAARNTGIELASGDLVLMIDADEVASPRFAAEHVGYHELRPDLVVLGPAARGGGGADRDPRAVILGRTSDNLNNLATSWHYLFAGNASVRREHLMAVGGFDEGFTGWGLEDSELGYRLGLRGLAFAFNPDAMLYNGHPATFSTARYDDWRRNLAHFVARHPAPEVALQWHLEKTFDPVRAEVVDWVPNYLRFEYAARALAGRLPQTREYTTITVDDDGADEVRRTLPDLAVHGPTVIVDRSCDRRLRAEVQCLDTPYDLLYYQRSTDDLGEWSQWACRR